MINFPKFFNKEDAPEAKMILPLLPLRDIVVFPYMVAPLFVGRPKSVNALSDAMGKDKTVFLATQRKAGIDNPRSKDISLVGTIGTVLQLLKLPDGSVKALVEGKQRGRIVEFIPNDEFFQVEANPLEVYEAATPKDEAVMRAILEAFEEYSKINKTISEDLVGNVSSITNPSQFSDTVASHFSFKLQDKQQLLEAIKPIDRLSILLQFIKTEIEIYKTEQNIKGRVKEQMEKTQKNYYLNEQMRAIKKEMGAEEEGADETKELEKRLKRKRMSKEAKSKAKAELKKLKLMTPMSAEATVVRGYVEWLISLPWYAKSKLKHDIAKAEAILDEDHYGLEKPKERILEYLAVQSLVKKVRGPILCLVGPPGVGKTSLAKSVGRATGRKFVRLSLGGVRDEAEIRGHRRTYIGSMPGKVIQSLKKSGMNNPVFCLDEVDKMSMDFRGDPSAALLEVLDPEQNYAFNDHYLDIDYDLSEILFITTANTLPDIPLPLQDRMEIIQLPGYTEHEKKSIAVQFLVPKQIKTNGLSDEFVKFEKEAIQALIREYTREAGVRSLEREISAICRKIAREYLLARSKEQDSDENTDAKDNTEKEFSYTVTVEDIQKYLGPAKFRFGQIEEDDKIGLVTGLAWTQVGGELLNIETLTMPGKGKLLVTGKLGDVMKESAQAAVSYVRNRAVRLSIVDDFYEKFDTHIHVPEGAIPKDGPSAGIAICTSLVSAYTQRPVYRHVAMTGEITLRGRVLPIGGLKEKILAAHRGLITKVLIPKDNEKDLKDIPESVTAEIEIVPVEHMDEVLTHALVHDENEEIFNNDIPIGIINGNADDGAVQNLH